MKLVLLTALGVGGATILGSIIGFLFKNITHKFSDLVLSFAAGVMLAAAILGLVMPSVEYGNLVITIAGIFAGAFSLNFRIGLVFKLLGNENVRVFVAHFQSECEAFFNAKTDVACVVHEDNFCAVVLHELAAFFADRIRHDDFHFVALDCADERKTNALVAAGRFYDNRVFGEKSAVFSVLNHVKRRAGLDRAADVESFEFDKDFSILGRGHTLKANHGGVAHGIENGVVDHIETFRGVISV